MKAAIRVFVAAVGVLVMAIGAWSVAAAQRNGASAGFIPDVRSLTSSWFHQDAQETEVEHPAEAAQLADDRSSLQQQSHQSQAAGQDNSKQRVDDSIVEASETPEPGDDNGIQDEATEAPQAHGEITGTVTAISGNTITIGGQIFQLAANAEGVANLALGAIVKIEFVTNPDGTVSVREIKPGDLSGNSDEGNQSGDDSSVQHESGSGSDSGSDGGHHGGGSGGGGDGGDGGSGG
jgi:hypothetical protein